MQDNKEVPIDSVLKDFASLNEGLYELVKIKRILGPLTYVKRCGWVSVSKDDENFVSLVWTSHKGSHMPNPRVPARSLTVDADGKLISYMESAISMWVKWGWGIGGPDELMTAHKFARFVHSHLEVKLFRRDATS